MEEQLDILKAENLCREFKTPDGSLAVLKGASLTVKTSEMISITGESGVGKSTLLHIFGGLDSPNSGLLEVSGESMLSKNQEELARFRNEKIGFVFQSHYLLSDFTALENVMMPILIAEKSQSYARQKGEQLLEQVGLIDRAKHLPSQLSGGEQQRVAVARSLANEPEIVLADEPSGNLDIASGHKLHELLFHLNEKNQTAFVIATHNLELAAKCDKKFKIVDGKLER